MALGSYTPSSDKIVHRTKVDFTKRNSIDQPVRLVQYDNRMPILAVSLFKDNEPYSVPSGYSVNIRVGKKGGKYVYNPALGASNSNQVVYFEITQAMVTDWGKIPVIVEIINGSALAGSSRITFDIDRNPAQEGDIESSSEGKALVDYVEQANKDAASAEASKNAAAKSAQEAESSKQTVLDAVDDAEGYAADAQASKTAAAQSEKNAASANTQAQAAKDTAVQKATDASNSAEAAAGSAASAASDKQTVADNLQTVTELAEQVATNTATVESNTTKAAESESKAKQYADAASTSANEAEASNVSAGEQATAAAASAEAAADSASAVSADKAEVEENLQTVQTLAEQVSSDAQTVADNTAKTTESEANAKSYADAAKASQTEVESHLNEAEALVTEASGYVDASKSSADAAAQSASDAAESLEAVKAYETNGEKWAKAAQSYAVGDTDYRLEEAKDNAKYYYEQARTAVNSLTGALKPKGNISFEDLLQLEEHVMGDYYNVTDEFTSTDIFTDGGNVHYPAGTDVFWTQDNQWNAVQGSGVSGVKGSSESNYRKGLVDIKPADLGLGKTLTITQNGSPSTYNGTEEVSVNIEIPEVTKETLGLGKTLTITQNGKDTTYDGSKDVSVSITIPEVTKESLGLENVNNTADSEKNVASAEKVNHALTITNGNNSVSFDGSTEKSINIPVIPEGIKNPEALTFTGAVEATYDGSTAKTVNIPVVTKESLGLGKVENKNSSEILALMSKDNVTNALGYEPPVNDTQGVNLLTGTKDFSGDWMWLNKWEKADETYRGLTVYKHDIEWSGTGKLIDVQEGETYTFSAFIRASAEKNDVVLMIVYTGEDGKYASVSPINKDVTVGTEWGRYSITFTIKTSGKLFARIEARTAGTMLYICGYKLEPGLVADPVWTPSPEDVLLKGEVDGRNLFIMKTATVNTYIAETGNEINNSPFLNERTSDYIPVKPNEKIAIRLITTNIIINSNDFTYWSIASWYKSDKTRIKYDQFSSKSDNTNSKLRDVSTVFVAPADAAYLRISARFYADGKIKVERGDVSTNWTPAPEDVLNDTVVGGTNLLTNTDFSKKKQTFAAVGGTASIDTIDGRSVLKFVSSSKAENHHVNQLSKNAASFGETFSASVLIYVDSEVDIKLRIEEIQNEPAYIYIKGSDTLTHCVKGWNKLTETYTINDTRTTTANFLVRFDKNDTDINKTFYMYHPKLEVGDVPTDWSPAPEDLLQVTDKAVANGVASLDANTKVPVAQIPTNITVDLAKELIKNNIRLYMNEDSNNAWIHVEPTSGQWKNFDYGISKNNGVPFCHSYKLDGTANTFHSLYSNFNKPTPQDIGALAASLKGAVNGVASLGADGKVPTNQLPEIKSSSLPEPYNEIFANKNTGTNRYLTVTSNHLYFIRNKASDDYGGKRFYIYMYNDGIESKNKLSSIEFSDSLGLEIYFYNQYGNTDRCIRFDESSFYIYTNKTNPDLGTSYYPWNQLYANKTAISTSDRNKKNTILPIEERYEQIFKKLKPVSYKFNGGKRVHIGFIAQDIEESMEEVNLSTMEFAAFCKNKIEPKEGEPAPASDEPQYSYSLRYGEFIALNTHMIQKTIKQHEETEARLNKRIDELEARVAKLESLVETLINNKERSDIIL